MKKVILNCLKMKLRVRKVGVSDYGKRGVVCVRVGGSYLKYFKRGWVYQRVGALKRGLEPPYKL